MSALFLYSIPFLDRPFGGAHVSSYVWFAGIILTALLVKKIFSRAAAWVTSFLAIRATSGKHSKLFISLLRKPLEWLFAVILFYIAFSFIEVPLNNFVIFHYHSKGIAKEVRLADVIDHLFIFFLILFTTLALSRVIDFFYHSNIERAHATKSRERVQILPLMKEVAKLLLWTIALFWILGTVFAVNIPALITGLGIGGVAIALAAKESVENLFASFTILADRPFDADDTVRLGSLEGKVERIGFRSTRLRGADGSLYIIPNKKLVDENLENLTQRDTRGMKLTINIKYGVTPDKVQAIIDELKAEVQKTLHVIQPIEVSLETFAENSFGIVLSYHLPQTLSDADIPAVKQQINMKAYSIVAKYTTPAAATVTQSSKIDKP